LRQREQEGNLRLFPPWTVQSGLTVCAMRLLLLLLLLLLLEHFAVHSVFDTVSNREFRQTLATAQLSIAGKEKLAAAAAAAAAAGCWLLLFLQW